MDPFVDGMAELVKQLGLTSAMVVVFLGFLAWAMRALKAGSQKFFDWGRPLIERIVDKHIGTMDAVCATQGAICKTQERLLETVATLHHRVEAMDRGKTIDEIHTHVVVMAEADRELLKTVRGIADKAMHQGEEHK